MRASRPGQSEERSFTVLCRRTPKTSQIEWFKAAIMLSPVLLADTNTKQAHCSTEESKSRTEKGK